MRYFSVRDSFTADTLAASGVGEYGDGALGLVLFFDIPVNRKLLVASKADYGTNTRSQILCTGLFYKKIVLDPPPRLSR